MYGKHTGQENRIIINIQLVTEINMVHIFNIFTCVVLAPNKVHCVSKPNKWEQETSAKKVEVY